VGCASRADQGGVRRRGKEGRRVNTKTRNTGGTGTTVEKGNESEPKINSKKLRSKKKRKALYSQTRGMQLKEGEREEIR